MKKRIYIYLLILVLIVIGFMYIIKPKWSPFYCSKYSSINSTGPDVRRSADIKSYNFWWCYKK